jgi:hypothetical protein
MAGAVHRTVRAAAPAGGFSFLFRDDHAPYDKKYDNEQNRRNNDSSEIFG